jgi:hypothetical protein
MRGANNNITSCFNFSRIFRSPFRRRQSSSQNVAQDVFKIDADLGHATYVSTDVEDDRLGTLSPAGGVSSPSDTGADFGSGTSFSLYLLSIVKYTFIPGSKLAPLGKPASSLCNPTLRLNSRQALTIEARGYRPQHHHPGRKHLCYLPSPTAAGGTLRQHSCSTATVQGPRSAIIT